MKKKNGFTLIELLAVIVILAIIALIATPIVLNLINRARKGAAVDAAYGVRKEAQLLYSTALMEHPSSFNKIEVTFSGGVATTKYYQTATSTPIVNDLKFELDGTKPSSGKITILGNGTITYSDVVINGYSCTIPDNGEVTCNNSGESTPEPITYRKYENGEIVYYNPTTNKFCSNYNIDNSITEYKGDTTSKTTDNQTGCLKWYAYLDSEESETVNLLLDHNTTARIQWNADNINVPLEESNLQSELDSLKNDSRWVLQPTIISAFDVADIVGYKEATGNDFTNSSGWFYLDSKDKITYPTTKGTSSYAWLYDRLNGSINRGARADGGVDMMNGYWTQTNAGNSVNVWDVDVLGQCFPRNSANSNRGLRPVITISKSLLD